MKRFALILVLAAITVIGQSSTSTKVAKYYLTQVSAHPKKNLTEIPNSEVSYSVYIPYAQTVDVYVEFRIDVQQTINAKTKYAYVRIPAGQTTASDLWRDLSDDNYSVYDLVAYIIQ